MGNLTKIIYGEEYAARMNAFDQSIEALDQKYPDVLQKDDKFVNYIVLTTNVAPGKTTFCINDPDGLIPNRIREEMLEIFNRNFNS